MQSVDNSQILSMSSLIMKVLNPIPKSSMGKCTSIVLPSFNTSETSKAKFFISCGFSRYDFMKLFTTLFFFFSLIESYKIMENKYIHTYGYIHTYIHTYIYILGYQVGKDNSKPPHD